MISFFSQRYLPTDRTGDVIYRITDVVAFVLCLRTIFILRKKPKSITSANEFNLKIVLLMAIPALILALFVHPSLNNLYIFDVSYFLLLWLRHWQVAWTFALYLESVAMLPQLYLFTKNGKEIESYVSHYVSSQGFSRLSAMVFWIFSFHELNDEASQGFGLVSSSFINL